MSYRRAAEDRRRLIRLAGETESCWGCGAYFCDRKGRYIGGFISPGVRISSDASASGTAQLPRVGLEVPETVIGKGPAGA